MRHDLDRLPGAQRPRAPFDSFGDRRSLNIARGQIGEGAVYEAAANKADRGRFRRQIRRATRA